MYRSPFHDPGPAEFADQFAWDGDGWLYRYAQGGAAYRVTDAEKDAFVAAFDRWQKRAGWTAIAILVGVLVVLWNVHLLARLPPGSGFLGILIGGGGRYLIDAIGLRAPAHALQYRQPVAPPLSPAARAQVILDHRSPTELVGTAFAAAGFLFLFGASGWSVDGPGLLVFVGFVWMATLAVRRLILERRAAGTDRADHAASSLT